MKAFLASDNEAIGAELRKLLVREGMDCPVSHVSRLDMAPERLAQSPSELVVVVLPDDPERTLGVLDWLEKAPRQNGERVLAVGPAANPKLVLRALRGAVDDYLDQAELEVELGAALGRWQASLASHQRELGRVVALLAPSGGSGSSTLAANLATVLATRHKTTALIDLKLHSGDLAALLDLKPTYTLADLCQNVTRMDRTLFERSLARHSSGVHLLAPPATSTTSPGSPLRGCTRASLWPSSRFRTSWSTSTIRSAWSKSRCCARPI
jgi:pilus assembly protein CpaE